MREIQKYIKMLKKICLEFFCFWNETKNIKFGTEKVKITEAKMRGGGGNVRGRENRDRSIDK